MGETTEKPFAGIVALSAGASADALFDRFVTEIKAVSEVDRPNAFVVLDEFVITWHQGEAESLRLLPSPIGARFVARQDLREIHCSSSTSR